MIHQTRYPALISIFVFVALFAIFTRHHYLPIIISQQKTYDSNKDVPVLDYGSSRGISEIQEIQNHKNFPEPSYVENEAVIEKQGKYRKFKKKLCKLNKSRLINLERFDFSKQKSEQIESTLHAFIMNPTDTAWFGGGYLSYCHYVDGGKYICMDELIYDILNSECVIFSFGISHNWTFQDMMDDLGCTVYAFDLNVNYPSKRRQNITFEKLAIAAKKDTDNLLDTLDNTQKKYHHENRKICYLKIDTEGSELPGL